MIKKPLTNPVIKMKSTITIIGIIVTQIFRQNTLCALITAMFNWRNGARSSEIGKIVHQEMYQCFQDQSPKSMG